ncbi:heat-inducible transcriptional repressor [Desulfitispora alkaliphila]|uniref:heat-inducible transcriptional repressor HrcA n=1 Tax=Desulfitispora alkaliphila TaxID=622674 RepID=UPI003D24977E
MNERKKKILQAIIHDYTKTAEPVGSRTIARKYSLGVSPATVRNEMADLEDMGLIEQPYTSAGRVPSNVGYRYYVDCIMEKTELTEIEEAQISNQYKTKVKEIENVIHNTGKLLSEITHYTAMVTTPEMGKKAVKRIQLIYLGPTQALAVIVLQSGLVSNRLMTIPQSVSEEDLNLISRVLNKNIQGETLDNIKRTVLQEIYADLIKQKKTLNMVMDILDESLGADESRDNKVYLDGTLNILNQPEFKDVEKIRSILGILNEEDTIRGLLGSNEDTGITIKIGSENKLEGFSDCSIITATYHIDGQVLGSVGLLGPTRMEYSKVVAFMEAITANLSEIMKKHYG